MTKLHDEPTLKDNMQDLLVDGKTPNIGSLIQ